LPRRSSERTVLLPRARRALDVHDDLRARLELAAGELRVLLVTEADGHRHADRDAVAQHEDAIAASFGLACTGLRWYETQRAIRHEQHVLALRDTDLGRRRHAGPQQEVGIFDREHGLVSD